MTEVLHHTGGVGLHSILDVLLVLLGCMFAFGWIQLPSIDIFYSVALALAGLIAIASPNPVIRRVAIAAMLFGLYLILRETGVISIPLLQYGLAFLLFVVGVTSIVRDVLVQNTQPTAEQEVKKD